MADSEYSGDVDWLLLLRASNGLSQLLCLHICGLSTVLECAAEQDRKVGG